MSDVVHVPYKGAGPGLADLVSGHIPIMSPNISGQVLGFHQAGKIRILAINSKARLKAAPDIPTAIEQGVPNMIGQLFLGIYAPAATPKAAVDAISAATKKAVDNAGIREGPDRIGLRGAAVLHRGFRAAAYGRGIRPLEAGGRTHRPQDELITRSQRRSDPLLRELAQRVAVDLVGRGERQLVHEPDEARMLVGRRVGEREFLDRVLGRRCARPSG